MNNQDTAIVRTVPHHPGSHAGLKVEPEGLFA